MALASYLQKALKLGLLSSAALSTLGSDEAEAVKPPIPFGPRTQKIINSPNIQGSSTFRTLVDFTFKEGPYAGKTIHDVVKNPKSKRWYFVFNDDSLGAVDKEEAWSLSAELGSRRYLNKFKQKKGFARLAQAKTGLNRKLSMEEPTQRKPETEALLQNLGAGELTPQSWVQVGDQNVQIMKPYADLLQKWKIVKPGTPQGGSEPIPEEV